MSYNSKYTGAQIEEILDSVGGKQDAISDLEEIRQGAAKGATAIQDISGKADNTRVDLISERLDDIESEMRDFATESQLNNKQDAIADLDTIRSGAALGATALQRIDYPQLEDNLIDSGFYHSPDGMLYRSDMEDAVQESLNKADSALQSENDPIFLASPAASITEAKKAEWDNKVDKVSGKQLSTEDFTSALKTKLEGLSNYDDTELSEALLTLRGDFDKLVSGDTTTAIKTFNEVIAFLDGVQDTQDLASIIASIEQQIAGKMDKVTLATVATSGSYNDLSNKPIIPTNVSQLNDDRGLVDKQFAHENFISIADIGSELKIARIDQFTTPYGSLLYAFPATANGDEDDVLLSHNTVKTINGESIVGSGDIVISGGGGSSSGSGAYAEVNHGTSDTTFTLTPNTFHIWDEVSALTLTLGSETAGVANEFLFQFTSGATATSLTLPDDIKWVNDAPPTIAENMIYQISILNGLAVVLEFNNAVVLVENWCTVTGVKTFEFQYPVASELTVNLGGKTATVLVGETSGSVSGMVEPGVGIISIYPDKDSTYIYLY